MKNILRIERPWIRYSQDYAFPSAVLSSDLSFQNWIYTNAVQLYYIKERKYKISYFYIGRDPNPISYIPLFTYQGIDKSLIRKSKLTAVEFTKAMIEAGYYITCLLNEYYIPSRTSYLERNHDHGAMIYGYDDNDEVVHIAGYDYTRQFRNHVLSYKNFEKAFRNIQREEDFCSCFKRNNIEYSVDVILMKNLLYDLICSRNTSEGLRMIQRPLENCYWGLEACGHIVDECSKGFDLRYFYALCEYVMLMKQRVQIVTQQFEVPDQGLSEKLNELEKKFKLLLNLALRINLKGQVADNVEIVKKKLNALLAEEETLLISFYNVLNG